MDVLKRTCTLLLLLVILVSMSGCGSKPFQYTFRQDRSCIEKIEICPFDYHNRIITDPWVSLTGEDIDVILSKLSSLDCWRLSGFDTPREFGKIIICIFYLDGEIEVIGTSNIGWVTPDGNWHIKPCFFKKSDLKKVLLQYIDADTLAEVC